VASLATAPEIVTLATLAGLGEATLALADGDTTGAGIGAATALVGALPPLKVLDRLAGVLPRRAAGQVVDQGAGLADDVVDTAGGVGRAADAPVAPQAGALDRSAAASRRLAESPKVPPGAVTRPGALDDYPSGSGFSGVYDPETGGVLAYPSSTTRLRSGAEPPTLLPRNGGHGDVNDFLAEATDRVTDGSTLGFTMFLRENGTIEVEWFSRMANSRFPGSRVPEAQRARILEAITAATGRVARSKQ